MTAVTPTIEWQFLTSWGPLPDWASESVGWQLGGRAAMPNPVHLPATGWAMKAGVIVYVGSAPSGPWPKGHLTFAITPGTGVTMQDWCFDETGSEDSDGNAKLVCNYSDQAEGAVWLTFASAGSFTVSCEYVSSEPAVYSSVALATTLNIVVA